MGKDILLDIQNRLSGEQLVKFLVSFAFNLTVTARNSYTVSEDTVDRPKALRGINEIVHRVLSRAMNVWDDKWRHAPDAFGDMIFELANIYGCVFELENAIAFSAESILRDTQKS